MIEYNINNKEYLLSIKPSYKFIPLLSLISCIIIILTTIIFKTYDVYSTKGYLHCNITCEIIIGVNVDDINKVKNVKYLKLNDKVIDYNKVLIGDIKTDEANKINVQNVNFEVKQLDNEDLNTFQDIKIYSNYESILKKIKKMII